MTDINNLDRIIGKSSINWTNIIAIGIALAGIIFGVQQCRNGSITQGDLEARADSMRYWRDQAGTEHAKVGQLVTSQAFVQRSLDSLKTIKGSKVTATTDVHIHGGEVLHPIMGGMPSNPYGAEGYFSDSAHYLRTQDTAEYVLTAADTLDWLRHNQRVYTSKWDTIKVTFDSATLIVNDHLHIVESQVKEGGLFNRRWVPYVDVSHDNPMLKTTDVKAWRVSVPMKRWAVGPSVNVYPKIDNGIKVGYSFGISLTYAAIKF